MIYAHSHIRTTAISPTHQIVYIKYLPFLECQLYLNKALFKKNYHHQKPYLSIIILLLQFEMLNDLSYSLQIQLFWCWKMTFLKYFLDFWKSNFSVKALWINKKQWITYFEFHDMWILSLQFDVTQGISLGWDQVGMKNIKEKENYFLNQWKKEMLQYF